MVNQERFLRVKCCGICSEWYSVNTVNTRVTLLIRLHGGGRIPPHSDLEMCTPVLYLIVSRLNSSLNR
jgi:hypothetical protein